MYKRFFEQRITHYNGQWYCYLCKTALSNLVEAQYHSENAHLTINTQAFDFMNKSITFTYNGYKMLLKHSIVIRDVQRDYFCTCCRCSISSLHNFCQHIKEKNHLKYMNAVLKRSPNKQQNSNDDTNNEQSNVSVDVENSTERINESNLSAEIQPICENKLTKDASNDSTQMANGTIASVPYALLQEAKTYNNFLMQYTKHYGQWYCHPCKSEFYSLTDVTRHSQNVHPNIGTQISDFREKSTKSSGIICGESLNNEMAVQSMPQGYFCVPCQCSIPSLDHFHEHSIGKKHKHMIQSNEKCINTNIVPKDPADKQHNVGNNMIGNQNVSVNAFDGNDSIRNLPSNFRTEEESAVSFKSYSKDSISDDLQIEKCVDMAFCCLCDMFIHKTIGKHHMKDVCFVKNLLKIFNLKVACIIKLEERKTIRAIQLNSKKFDGTTWPEYTKTVAKYTCDQCNKIVEENDIINHEITVHQNHMMSSMKYIYNWPSKINNFNIIHYPLFKCSFCNEIIHGISSLSIHFSKREHEENIRSLTDIKRQEYDNSKDVQIYFEPLEFLSIISFENNDLAVQIKEQPVIYIKNHYTTFHKNLPKNKFIYICFTCQFNARTTKDIINHLCKTSKHLKHFQDICLTYNCMHEVLISKEHSMNGTHEIKSLVSREDISIDNGLFKKLNINETQENTEQSHNHNLTIAANVNNKNDGLCQNEENNSGLFMSSDIFAEINIAIKYNFVSKATNNKSCTRLNKKSALDRYNKKYSTEFLDFEKIMFACNKQKLMKMKLNLQFFLPHFDKMRCLVCNNLQLCNAQTIYEHINCKEHVMLFKKLSENKEHFELLKELIQPIHLKYAKCFACDMVCRKYTNASNSENFKYHTSLPSHKNTRKQLLRQAECVLNKFQNLWYNIQYFACVECNMRVKQKIQFLEHLNTIHRKVLNNKDNSKFDFCLTCATLWYKNESCAEDIPISYQKHCQLQMHRYLQKSNDFAVMSLPQSLQKLLKNINETAANLFQLSNNVLKDKKVTQLTDALNHIFKTHGLPVEVCPFGSRVTGLALPNSDIDVYLNFGNECTEPELLKRSKQIQDCLRTDKNWDIELTLDRSRTPIIKVRHRLTELQCDISFSNGLSVENSKFIRSFYMAYPSCRKLTLFLKKWLSLGGLSGPERITNYVLIWLVIFYLQVKYKVPSIAALIKSHNQSKLVSGWETGVGDNIPIKLPIHQLLLEFFKYYDSFDYMHLVICPLLGKTCQKRAFAEISILPNSMEPYIAQLGNKKPEYFRIDSSMCVQDPFDLSHNLTKAVSILTLRRFKHYCNESLSVLCNVIETSSKK